MPKKGGGLFGAEGGLAAFEEGSERFGRFGGSRLAAPDGFLFFGGDEVIWAERFPLSTEGLARSRQVIARQITGALATEIERNELVRHDYERDADAYHSFLIGQGQLKNLDLRDIRRARKSFRDALQASAGFAPAISAPRPGPNV